MKLSVKSLLCGTALIATTPGFAQDAPGLRPAPDAASAPAQAAMPETQAEAPAPDAPPEMAAQAARRTPGNSAALRM